MLIGACDLTLCPMHGVQALLADRRTREELDQEERRLSKQRVKAAKSHHDNRHWKQKELDQMYATFWPASHHSGCSELRRCVQPTQSAGF